MPATEAFLRAADLMVKLHQLISRGEGDSDAADAIRDEVDPLWDRLDARERELYRRLSMDLYNLHEVEVEGFILTSRIPFELFVKAGQWEAEGLRDMARRLRLAARSFPTVQVASASNSDRGTGACTVSPGKPSARALLRAASSTSGVSRVDSSHQPARRTASA